MFDSSIRRGDIYYVDKYDGQFGSEQYSGRPGVIVSNNINNENSKTVEVVYLTTKPKKKLPTHVKIQSTGRESTVLCEQVTTVSVERLGTYKGRCTDEELRAISEAIVISLALKDRVPEHPPAKKLSDIKDPDVRCAEMVVETSRLQAELGAYKEMCNRLLDCLAGKSV